MKLAPGTILIKRQVKSEADLDKAWRVTRAVRGRQEDGKVGRSYEVVDPRDAGHKTVLTTMDIREYETCDPHGFVLGLEEDDRLVCDCGAARGECPKCGAPVACGWKKCVECDLDLTP